MKPPYALAIAALIAQLTTANYAAAQSCAALSATWSATESRCSATGRVIFNASGGSGNYNYSLSGPITTGFTSSAAIGGLPGGTYTATIKDIVSNCTISIPNVVVPGTYIEPRFGLSETDVTCTNGNNGTITVTGLTNGRAPYTFVIVAPSQMGIGTTSSTGAFTGLVPGSYSVQMTDSCGAIQTRTVTIQNYSWSVYSSSVTLTSCTSYTGQLTLRDSKGNLNTSGPAFNGFWYGVAFAPGDTTWFSTPSFAFDLGQSRKISLVAKDPCGLVQSVAWTNTVIPSLGSGVTLSSLGCTGFNAAITSPVNLTSPQYCLLDAAGNVLSSPACNTTGAFTNIPYGSYCIRMTNSCYDTVIKRCFTQAQPVPSITGAVTLSAYTCTGATATVTGQHNLISPQYCLVDVSGNPVPGFSCNGTGVFTNVPFGNYKVKATDGCTGTVINIAFTSHKAVKSVAATVTLSGNTCTTFKAQVTGATNLISPQYCLVDSIGNPITCNSTGVFTGLAYGSYCINITDACGDTTIQRCFHQYIPSPTGGAASITNKTCHGFDVTITGQANVFNGLYCLQDGSGNPVAGIPCNSTGVFTNVPYGSYCLKTTDACSNATNLVCFTVTQPVEAVGSVSISNQTCAGFTATQTGQQNLTNPTYCLLDSLNNPVGSCNSTGIFAVTGYGRYTISTTDGCSGQVFLAPFTVTKPVPSVSSTVSLTNQTCTTFSATITGQTNLTGPHYYLKDNTGAPVSDNTTGRFDNLGYGSYCIDITNSCGDTTIERCFTAAAPPVSMSLTAAPSCTYNATDITVTISSGVGPFNIKVYDLAGHVLKDTNVSTSPVVIRGLPRYLGSTAFSIYVYSNCGTFDTHYIMDKPTRVIRNYSIVAKCPSSAIPNGSGDLKVTATSNLTPFDLLITNKNGTPVSINYSLNSGSSYTFSNLDAGTYILTYTFSACSSTVSDTVTVPGYTFPSLSKSAAFQCNDNSFTISAVSTGVAPFTYQIIGSEPETPSVTTVPQTTPLFSINTGTQYSLIRLRAIDACGNSALSDVDILPLQNTIISASLNCINQGTVLTTNTLPNANYSWYYKKSADATDSVLVGTDTSYTISSLTVADTGVYVNHMSINSGCLTKLSYFHLDGTCNGMWVLPLSVSLTGHTDPNGINKLSWMGMGDPSIRKFLVERSGSNATGFEGMATVEPEAGENGYSWTDWHPIPGTNYYRLYIIRTGNSTYSNTIALSASGEQTVTVFPNPATSQVNLTIRDLGTSQYTITLYTAAGQIVYRSDKPIGAGKLTIPRTDNMPPGSYLLKVENINSGSSRIFKVTLE